jgi:hypothetical protein
LALASLWYTPSRVETGTGGRAVILNRVTGNVVSSLQTVTKIVGPDGAADTGWGLNELSVLTSEAVVNTGSTGLLLFWAGDNTPVVTIGGVAQTVGKYNSASWSLYYVKNISASGAVVINTVTLSDVRFISASSYTDPLLNIIPYYYNDIKNNAGRSVLPR